MSDRPWYEVESTDLLVSPSVLLYPERIEQNLDQMISLVGDVRQLRPHVKTHKLPQIIEMKRNRGITRFKAATIAEAEMTALAGGEDVLLAYPIVGPNVNRFLDLVERFPLTRFSALVDDQMMLRQIGERATARSLTAHLYMDLDVGMHRTGFAIDSSNTDSALQFYLAMIATPGVSAIGLHAYDGHLHESDTEILQQRIKASFDPVWELSERIMEAGQEKPKLVLAGTPTSRFLAEVADVEVGAGTTVLWDAGQPVLSPDLDFLHAAVIVSRVISRPAQRNFGDTNTRNESRMEGQLCLDLGHKAIASEMPSPRVQWLQIPDARQVMHSEEHMVIQTALADSFPVGTLIYGIPTHVCPTMALHQDVGVVRQNRIVERWGVTARDRRITI